MTPRLRAGLIRAVGTAVVSAACSAPLSAQPSPTAILDRVRVNASQPIDFHAATYPDTVYVGQQVTYQVAVLLSESARARLRRNPEFLPPELRGLLTYELGTPRRVASRNYGVGNYEAHVFQRALFAVAPGTLMVPAPQLSYTLPQSSSYFSREEQFLVRAESAQLVVKPLPLEGQPQDFTGAIGQFRASLRLDAGAARVGDPLVLTMRVDGIGNVKLLPRPTIDVSWAASVPGTERVRIDTTGTLVRGYKEFDWILTPTQAGGVEVPSLRYSYFNPYRRAYEYAETTPATVNVDAGTLATSVEGDNIAVVSLRPWRGTPNRSMVEWLTAWGWPVWLLLIGVPLPWAAFMVRHAVGRMVRTRQSASRDGHASAGAAAASRYAGNDPGDHARETRRILLTSLAQRLQVAPQALVSRRDVERTLRRRGVTRDTTAQVLRLLDELAEQGFGNHAGPPVDRPTNTSRTAQADALLDLIDREAVKHARRIGVSKRAQATFTLLIAYSTTLTGALMLPAGPVSAQPVTPVLIPRTAPSLGRDTAHDTVVSAAVARASALYEQRQYARAAEQFALAVDRRPVDADLLANWGAASWAAGDTVASVIAWQRAARLEPLAGDLQQHLALLPPGATAGIATVPMIPVSALTMGAWMAWLLGWSLLAYVRYSRAAAAPDDAAKSTAGPPWTHLVPRLGVGAIAVAVASGATAIWGYRELDATRLHVIRQPDSMRMAPGTDANALGGIATGDVVRLEHVEAQWHRVVHADGRRGWIPAARSTPLVSPTVIR